MLHDVLLVVHDVLLVVHYVLLVVQDVLHVFHNVLQVFHNVLQCLVSRATIGIAALAATQSPVASGIGVIAAKVITR